MHTHAQIDTDIHTHVNLLSNALSFHLTVYFYDKKSKNIHSLVRHNITYIRLHFTFAGGEKDGGEERRERGGEGRRYGGRKKGQEGNVEKIIEQEGEKREDSEGEKENLQWKIRQEGERDMRNKVRKGEKVKRERDKKKQ